MAASDTDNRISTAPQTRVGSAAVYVLTALIAGFVAAFIVSLSSAEALAVLGIPDPGVLTVYGLPAVRAIGEIAAVIAVGSLLLAAFLVPPQKSGVLDVDGYRAVRTAGQGVRGAPARSGAT